MFEKEAEEYAEKECKNCNYRCDKPNMFKRLSNKIRCHAYFKSYEGYITGATENGIQWHDLRKDPNDLPNEEKDVLVYSGEQWRMSVCRYFPQHKAWEAGSDTIAWCEIPTFKE